MLALKFWGTLGSARVSVPVLIWMVFVWHWPSPPLPVKVASEGMVTPGKLPAGFLKVMSKLVQGSGSCAVRQTLTAILSVMAWPSFTVYK